MKYIYTTLLLCVLSITTRAQIDFNIDEYIENQVDSLVDTMPDTIAEPEPPKPTVILRSRFLKIERQVDDELVILQPNGESAHYLWPVLSPDGTKIAYYITGQGTYVCDFDGQNSRFVAADCYAPQWYNNSTIMGYTQMIKGRTYMAYNLEGKSTGHSDATLKAAYKVPRINQYKSVQTPVNPKHPRVYINPGHGSWTDMDRPMSTIPYPKGTNLPDTCGFYESNTDLWVCMELGGRLRDAGYEVMFSRTANGPYPTTHTFADKRYNLPLAVIAAEADSWEADMFISVHSNAAKDGSMVNYPLILYRGNNKNPFISGSHEMASAVWPYLTEAMRKGFEWQSDYKEVPCIRGDLDFYHGSSIGPNGTRGYLGVMKHERPGFLVETYFHTYQPARHRALNPDYCAQEGVSLARGIKAFFGTAPDREGHIVGLVKDNTLIMSNRLYHYASGTHDAYTPLNGTIIVLYDEHHKRMGSYTVDNNYNGLFAFWDLKPGKYYLAMKCEGYFTKSKNGPDPMIEVEVKANETTFPIVYMRPDRPEPEPEPVAEPAEQENQETPDNGNAVAPAETTEQAPVTQPVANTPAPEEAAPQVEQPVAAQPVVEVPAENKVAQPVVAEQPKTQPEVKPVEQEQQEVKKGEPQETDDDYEIGEIEEISPTEVE